jgi:hypothetical protein
MKLLISGFLVTLWWGLELVYSEGQSDRYHKDKIPVSIVYEDSLRYNVYRFRITAADSGAVRDLIVKAYRGELLLTNFRTRIDGGVVGVEVADLDNNRFPELYVYSTSDGSGSFGRVYGWQFLAERKANILSTNWLKMPDGYMGHDSLWVERDILCRQYPIYNSGDANAEPTGGVRMIRYRLKAAGKDYTLVPEQPIDHSASR